MHDRQQGSLGSVGGKPPLEGKRIVVTRPREQSAELSSQLRALGATPIECPAISMAPLRDTSRLDEAISSLDTYDWVIFTSVNGVQAVVGRMAALGNDASALCSRKLGAIGPATRSAIEALGCTVHFVPTTYVAEAIIEEIEDIAGQRVLLPRADIAREALAAGLRSQGARVDEVAAYNTVHGDEASSLATLLRPGMSAAGADAVTFTSSSTVRYTIERLCDAGLSREEVIRLLDGTPIVCIGPITAGTAREYGLPIAAVAEDYTTHGLVEALVKLLASHTPAMVAEKEQRDA